MKGPATQQREFFDVIAEALPHIKATFPRQIPHPNAQDLIQDAIIKVASYIDRKGLKPNSNYISYLFLTYRNLIYNLNLKKRRISFNSEGLPEIAQDLEAEAEELERREHREQLQDDILNYVNLNYSPLEAGLFKFYHKTDLTYKEISDLTGYSFSYIWKKNKIIIDDLRKTFGTNSTALARDKSSRVAEQLL